METTNIVFSFGSKELIIGLCCFFFALLAVIWKGKKEIADAIKESIGDFKDRFVSLENKMDVIWKDKIAPAHSPRQLNDLGQNILNNSGIKEIVDENKEKLFQLVKAKNTKNPYDAERAILEIMIELPKHCPEVLDKLKNGAFSTGTDIEALLFVGSIYLRNQIFSDLGFSITDLDKPKNEDKKV